MSRLSRERSTQQELHDELGAADVLLVGAPLYNYTVPSTLKAEAALRRAAELAATLP